MAKQPVSTGGKRTSKPASGYKLQAGVGKSTLGNKNGLTKGFGNAIPVEEGSNISPTRGWTEERGFPVGDCKYGK